MQLSQALEIVMHGRLSRVALAASAAILVTTMAYASGPHTSVLYTFRCTGSNESGPCPQGGRPDALTIGSDGVFYGTAQVSAEGSSAPLGGTIFSLTSSGVVTVLHAFKPGASGDYPNGVLPGGNLAEGADGKLYGATLYGAVDGCHGYCGYGVLYRINKDGSGFQILHKNCSQTGCTDGGAISPIAAPDGNLYGAGFGGGTGGTCGCGIIYRVTPSTGAYKIVFNFNSATTGTAPSQLVLASDGSFWGLDLGPSNVGQSLFHYTPSTGAFATVALHFPSFNGLPSEGSMLTIGANGNFYGIYGIYGESGAGVFEVEPDGSNLQLFPFYISQDGAGDPQAMMLASDGNLWVTNYNGSTGYGSIITLSPEDGSLIQTFSPFSASSTIGAFPVDLLQASDGTLWGTAMGLGKASGDHFADGTVFSLNAGLPPR
jgi:streptogramin lyase